MRLYNNTHYKATLIQFKLHTVIVTFWTKKKKKKTMFYRHFTDMFFSTLKTLLLFYSQRLPCLPISGLLLGRISYLREIFLKDVLHLEAVAITTHSID